MGYTYPEFKDYIDEGRERGKKTERLEIARRLKSKGMFTEEFISEITGVDVKTIRRLKCKIPAAADDGQK